MSYKIADIVDQDEIPDWQRREPKWEDLVEQVLSLQPGKSLKVVFDNQKAANRARNAVRDNANLKARTVVVRTRLVKDKEGEGAVLYLMRVGPAKIKTK